MEWFRMHTEARTDKKLESLTDSQFRIWFRLMCLASEQPGDGWGGIPALDEEILAIEVAGGDVEELRTALDRLHRLKMLTTENGATRFTNWEKRQYMYPSDQPERVRQRVAKHRQKHDVTNVTSGNEQKRVETDPDTDTDNRLQITETDTESTSSKDVASVLAFELGTSSPLDIDRIDEYVRYGMSETLMRQAVEIMREKKKDRSYAFGILRRWKSMGFKTIEDVANKDTVKPILPPSPYKDVRQVLADNGVTPEELGITYD